MQHPGFVFRALCNDGVAADALLNQTGLTQDNLSDPNYRGDFAKLYQFYLNVIELSGDPHIGIKLAQRFRASYMGSPFLAAKSAASFEDALETLARLLVLAFQAFNLSWPVVLKEDPEARAFPIRSKLPLDQIAYFSAISALVMYDGLFRALLQVRQVTLRAQIATPKPDGWDKIASTMPFPVRFGAKQSGLIVSTRLLSKSLPDSDALNHQQLLGLCDKLASQIGSNGALSNQVLPFL